MDGAIINSSEPQRIAGGILFPPYQIYKIFNALAINLLGNLQHFPTVPMLNLLILIDRIKDYHSLQ